MNRELLKILKSDVKPALGCTGPISVVFATSVAKDAVGGTLQSLRVIMDKDTYKNSISVATPGTPYKGVLEPAVVGALYGKSEYGLEVIKELKDWDPAYVERFAQEHTTIEIDWAHKGMGIYIEAYATTDQGVGHAIVARTHDGVVLREANGVVLEKEEGFDSEDYSFEEKKPIRAYSIRDFYEFAQEVPLEDISFLRQALKDNYALAMAGLEKGLGARFGQGFQQIGGEGMVNRAKMLAAAAADARMSGEPLSAMSCGGSGNVGITASVPLIAIGEGLGKSEEDILRALALSYLLTICGKAHIGRLSPMCACALVASTGITAGTCYLLGGDYHSIEDAIGNLVGATGGILCDGAKNGCALKLSAAVGTAIDCAQLAVAGVAIPKLDGLVGNTGDDTLSMLGRIASKGMLQTDELMCREIIIREGKIN